MMEWSDAVRGTPEGTMLDVEVVPGAARAAFPAGYNPWRNRLEARVAAPPVDGRANEALLQLVADFFEVPMRRVRLAAGETSRQKRVLVVGMTRDEALAKLSGSPAEPTV